MLLGGGLRPLTLPRSVPRAGDLRYLPAHWRKERTMSLGNTTRSARPLIAMLGMCSTLGHARPAQAEAPESAAAEPATVPRLFDGNAGFVRLVGYSLSIEAVAVGVLTTIRSGDAADDAAKLTAPLRRDFGPGACKRLLAANASACGNLADALTERDKNGDFAVGSFLIAGVLSAVATASIWLWRTPGTSGWPPDWFRLTPTAGPKSGGVVLQGTW